MLKEGLRVGYWMSLTSVWTIPGLDACSSLQSLLPGAPTQVTGAPFRFSMPSGLSSYPLTLKGPSRPTGMKVLGGGDIYASLGAFQGEM